MDFKNKIKNSIDSYSLLKQGDAVLVGVSGGPDSMSLLCALLSLRSDMGLRIYVAHINHGLRKGAGLDERFVERFCRSKNIEFVSVKVSIRKTSEKSSIEEIAREERFKALLSIAKQKRIDAIALGHNRDDVAETVMMRIIRGAGLLGLQAILPKRAIGNIKIIRPLLDTQRKEIEIFLRAKKIKFRTDPTNKQKKFLRNKIRHDLIPYLEKEFNPNIKQSLVNLANTSAVDYECLKNYAGKKLSKLSGSPKTAEKGMHLPLTSLKNFHPGLRRMVMRLAIQKVQGNTRRLTASHIKDIENLILKKPSGSSINLPHRLIIQKETNSLSITSSK